MIYFKRLRDRNGCRDGGTKCLLWIVNFILEQIVNGTPPTYICQNFVSQVALTIPSIEVKKYQVLGW